MSRPWFRLAVTGRPDLIPPAITGLFSANRSGVFERHPPLMHLAERLDALLARRRCGHRVMIHVRGTTRGADGIDQVARLYAHWRGFDSCPFAPLETPWGPPSPVVRDLKLLLESQALVWVGPREGEQDPVYWAGVVGMRVELVELPGLAAPAQTPAVRTSTS